MLVLEEYHAHKLTHMAHLLSPVCISLQAAQVRKSSYVPDPGVKYDPDRYHSCTIYAGTMVQQVRLNCMAHGRGQTACIYGTCRLKLSGPVHGTSPTACNCGKSHSQQAADSHQAAASQLW